MSEPSSGLVLTIIGIILVVLVGIYGFTTVQNQKEAGNEALTKIESMNQALLESDYTQYDATEITGSQVINIIKRMEAQGDVIAINVNNGNGITNYVYATDLTTKSSNLISEAKKKSNLNVYINPAAKFIGKIIRDEKTGAIISLDFALAN